MKRAWIVVVLALVVRLVYLFSLRGDVLFEHPILDEQRYVESALHGEDRPYWQPPGIIYVLSVTGLYGTRVLQALVSAAACLLLFLLGRKLFSPAVGLAAAAILAAHGVVVHAGGELLPAIWILFFDLLMLWFLVGERAFLSGLALGISALFSPLILPFTLVAAVWLRRPRAIALMLLGVMLPILPVTARNHAHGGEWVLVSTNGGLNLYIGNNEHYRDTFALRPGRHWEELTTQPERLGIREPGAQSRWFTRQALAFMTRHPARAAGLYLRKLYLFFNGAEIPRDSELHIFGVWGRFPDGILIPLALAGFIACWRERRRLALLYAFIALQAMLTALFFVSARHRVPALPLFALMAAAAAVQWRRAWPALLAGLVLLNLPVWESTISLAGESDFYRGIAYARELHDPRTASEYFRRAAAANPGDARAWFELGNVLAQLHDDGCVDAWLRAAGADPWDLRPRRRAAMALVQRGDTDGAIAAVRAQVDSQQREPALYAPDWFNLCKLYVQQARLTDADAACRAAKAADPAWFAEHVPALDPVMLKALQGP